jgi:hypothetical protein
VARMCSTLYVGVVVSGGYWGLEFNAAPNARPSLDATSSLVRQPCGGKAHVDTTRGQKFDWTGCNTQNNKNVNKL